MNTILKDNLTQKRDSFSSNTGFILACIGSAVGMGNIWRFPYMVADYGGFTFIIPYFIFVILIGSTGVMEEMALGRATGGGPITAFGKCSKLRFGTSKPGSIIGWIPVIGSLALAIGYTVVMGWIFKYTYMALTTQLFSFGHDMEKIGATFSKTASAGGNNLFVIIAILSSLIIMIFGISKGIEKANKIILPTLFALFIGLAIYISTLPNALNGYSYIFTINPQGLLNPLVWIYAFGQAFFSLSIAGNGTVIYGSYLSKKEDIIKSAKYVSIFDTFAALLASFVIIPAMASASSSVSVGGPGLMFIYLVNVFNGMPGGLIIGIIFYICVLFAGITSLFNLYEAPIATLQDKLKLNRPISVLIICSIGCIVALLIQGIVANWMDFVSIIICPLGAALAGIFFYWIAGKEFANNSVNEGAKKPIGKWFYPLGKFVLVPLAIIAIILGIIFGGIG